MILHPLKISIDARLTNSLTPPPLQQRIESLYFVPPDSGHQEHPIRCYGRTVKKNGLIQFVVKLEENYHPFLFKKTCL